MKMDVHYSSETDYWETPQRLFNELHMRWNFSVDAAASDSNAKLAHYWTEEDNALKQNWMGLRVWLNPPYGHAISSFMRKCHEERHNAELICALVPARTDTRWWHDYVQDKADVWFLKGRLKFEIDGKPILNKKTGRPQSAPFPSALLLYGAKWT